jgi:ribosomal protein S4
MTKRNHSKYDLVRRYIQDPIGKFYSVGFRRRWLEDAQEFKIFINNVKILEKRIKEKFLSRYERKKQKQKEKLGLDKKNFNPFYYRVDIIKLIPKRKKKTIHLRRLKIRHKIRMFATQMMVKQFNKKYLKKARRSAKMLKSFFFLFETRLDVIIYRMGLMRDAATIRQLINHNNFLINNKPSKIPGQQIKLFDFVSVTYHARLSFFLIFSTFREVVWELVREQKKNKFIYISMQKERKRLKKKYGFEEIEINKKRFFYYFGSRGRRRKYRLFNTKKKLFFRKCISLIQKLSKKRFFNFSHWKKKNDFIYKSLCAGRTYLKWGSFFFFDILPFISIPSYLELNYRIFGCSLIKSPTFKGVVYPFRVNKLKLPSLSYKF